MSIRLCPPGPAQAASSPCGTVGRDAYKERATKWAKSRVPGGHLSRSSGRRALVSIRSTMGLSSGGAHLGVSMGPGLPWWQQQPQGRGVDRCGVPLGPGPRLPSAPSR